MLFRYAFNGFLVWISCITNSICKVHEFLATCFYLFTCQFGSEAFVLWGFCSCHLAYNSSCCVTRGRFFWSGWRVQKEVEYYFRESLCHTGGSEYLRSTQFRKPWQCWLQNYETKVLASPQFSLQVKTLKQAHVVQQLGLVRPRTRPT